MQVNLQDDEVSALINALNFYIPELREEIGSTEQLEMRESLKAQEAALSGFLAKIGGSIANTNMPELGADNPPWGGPV
ncbi:MAG TPA: hypothetical protein VM409_05965 [Chloroflexia bacterium]|nr:hypothetical protein [Chloroflexia bacterium]